MPRPSVPRTRTSTKSPASSTMDFHAPFFEVALIQLLGMSLTQTPSASNSSYLALAGPVRAPTLWESRKRKQLGSAKEEPNDRRQPRTLSQSCPCRRAQPKTKPQPPPRAALARLRLCPPRPAPPSLDQCPREQHSVSLSPARKQKFEPD